MRDSLGIPAMLSGISGLDAVSEMKLRPSRI